MKHQMYMYAERSVQYLGAINIVSNGMQSKLVGNLEVLLDLDSLICLPARRGERHMYYITPSLSSIRHYSK